MKAEGKLGPHWWLDPRFDVAKPGCNNCLDERFVPCGPNATMMPCNVCNLAAFIPSEEELVRRIQIPEIHYGSTLDNWLPQTAPAVRACREYVALWPPEKPFLTIYGGNGCIAGETEIPGPYGATRVDDLWRRGASHMAWARDTDGRVRAVRAEPPFIKGRADLYRVILSNGDSITTTMDHRFLVESGVWQPLSQIGLGARLPFFEDRSQSTSEYDQLACQQGERRLIHRETGWSDGCSGCFHRDDEQPLSVAVDGSGHLQAQGGVQGCSRSSGRADDLVQAEGRIHLGQPSCRRSTICSSRASHLLVSSERLLFEDGCRSPSLSNRPRGRVPERSHQRDISLQCHGAIESSVGAQYSPLKRVCTVVDISYERNDVYYDLHVPGLNNYLAGGVWNHNTGKTHLACAVLQVVAGEFRQQGFFWPVIDLMARMRAAMDEGSDETPDHIEQWTRDMKMLVLDDLGAIKETGWTSERISGIVDYRWRNKLPTVFTFDVGLDTFIPRIRSRIAGPQTATVIRLEGADKRLGAYSI